MQPNSNSCQVPLVLAMEEAQAEQVLKEAGFKVLKKETMRPSKKQCDALQKRVVRQKQLGPNEVELVIASTIVPTWGDSLGQQQDCGELRHEVPS